jgi:hypothetical protein
MARKIRTVGARDLSYQIGEGTPNHVSPMGSKFVNSVNGDIYYNRDGCVCWELNITHITDNNAKVITNQPSHYGRDNVGLVINDVNKEIPVGKIDEINTEFSLNNVPEVTTEYVFLNGLLQEYGPNSDYTIVGDKLLFNYPPMINSKLIISYKTSQYIESSYRVDREKPIGLLDEINVNFTLENTPNNNSESVFLNGLLQEYGPNSDYVIIGNRIVFNYPPMLNSRLVVSYTYFK